MKCDKFIESARAFLAGGRGGNGCSSFRREKFVPRGGPSGGNGGKGGSVVLQADRNITSLIGLSYRPHRQAQDGTHGKGKDLHGRNGKDLILKVPCGTEVWDEASSALLGDLTEDGAKLVVADGGKGGIGNGGWKRGSSRSIYDCSPGEPGEQRTLQLELKIVADIGLVGFPNAGKSSLLACISRAHPRVAPYPFTTLHPVVGTVQYETFTDLTVVDIPGIIKNAHQGAGLGHKFLRHVERARFLVFIIDMAGSDGRNPDEDYFVIMNELRLHKKELSERPAIIAANKMDLPEAGEHLHEFEKSTGKKALPISTVTQEGIHEFKQAIYSAVTAMAPDANS